MAWFLCRQPITDSVNNLQEFSFVAEPHVHVVRQLYLVAVSLMAELGDHVVGVMGFEVGGNGRRHDGCGHTRLVTGYLPHRTLHVELYLRAVVEPYTVLVRAVVFVGIYSNQHDRRLRKYLLINVLAAAGISLSAHDTMNTSVKHHKTTIPICFFIILSIFSFLLRQLFYRHSCCGHWHRRFPCSVRPGGRPLWECRSRPPYPAPACRDSRHRQSVRGCER